MSKPYLSCRGVSKRFGSVLAVDDAGLDVPRGQMLALLGPSGCGKTTLLRLIAGYDAPDAGEIVLDGRVLSGPGAFVPPHRRRVALVFQDFALFPHMNVASNIGFGLPKGADRRRRVAELLALVDLEGVGDRLPHQLSGGQQQRVALARALASDPALILLDEPFSNLDPAIRARVRREVRQLIHTVGVTAVFVTHDQEEAMSTAEQVAVMIGGQVLQTGTPAEVYEQPVSRVVGEFVGDANFLPGTVRDGVIECELGRLPSSAIASGPVEVMIRSENLALSEDGTAATVIGVEYFGHDQVATVRLNSGAVLRVRLLARLPVTAGQSVAVVVHGPVAVFPRSD